MASINFDRIEGHNENIQPIRSGRSARAFAEQLTPPLQNPHLVRSDSARHEKWEEELKTTAELDDPLRVWLDYIKWTVETFPPGHSAESGLLNLLERATREFADDIRYKSDIRYLKLWLQYARDFSDSPREVFTYLARKDIGQSLATYYEEFAALLELHGKRNAAAEIYHIGIERNAMPVARLERKYQEFLHRLKANPIGPNEPTSPALSVVRPALSVKPFGGLGASAGLGAAADQQQWQPQPASSKPKKQMAIFSDADQQSSSKAKETTTGGWDSIETLQQRKKDNTIELRPWAGETPKQHEKASDGEKLMRFRDHPYYKESRYHSSAVPQPGKRPERAAINLESIYAENGEEFCPQELLAKKRGLYGIGINWHEVQQRRAAAAEKEASRRMPANNGSLTPIKIKTILSPSPNKGKVRRKPRTGNIGPNSEPTVTFHTRAATDDIYGIFNQPIQKKTINEGKGMDSGDDSDVSEGDYTATITSGIQNHTQEVDDTAESVQSDFPDDNYSRNAFNQNKATQDVFETEDTTMMPVQIPVGKMEKLSIFADEPTHPPARKLQIPEPPPNFNPPTNPFSRPADRHLPFMTPIVERTETLPMTALKNRAMQEMQTPSRSALGMPAIMDDDDEEEEEEEEEGSGDEDEDEDEEMGGSPFNKKKLFSPPPKPKPFSPPPQRPMGRPPLGIKSSKLVPLGTKPQPPVQPVAAPVQKPIIDDKVCNPLDEGMRKTVFQKLSPPLKTYSGYYESTTRKSARAAIVQKYVRSLAKTESGKTASIPKAPLVELFTPNGVAAYTICRELGRGAFAPVYLVENHIVGDLEEEAEEAGIDPAELKVKLKGRQRFEALKMEDPPNSWEFYLIRQTKMRLAGTRMADSIINAPEMHLFEDEMFLFLEYRGHGSMLDLVNYSKSEAVASGGTGLLDELLVMFLSVELLRTVEAMHATGLIHGDLKADNALARFDPIDDAKWDSNYHPDGSGGWSSKGILLIDFGRAIDMKLFRPEVQFIADWETDHQDCAEMREMRPWTYQVDYHGLAAIIHSLLFGRYIETAASKSGLPGVQSKHYKITQPLKRYWQKEIWTEVFDVLLNPLHYVAKEQTGAMPINSSLRMIRERMEVHLENNCAAGIGLKGMLKKMEGALTKRK